MREIELETPKVMNKQAIMLVAAVLISGARPIN
jgi:hypothetical protein